MKAKICVIGEFAVGKTSLTRRLVQNTFDEAYRATLGVAILQKQLLVGGVSFGLVVWDLEGGEDRIHALRSYFTGAAGAVLVADLTRPATIEKLSIYADFLRDEVPGIQLVVALNKVDLVDPEQVDFHALRQNLSLDSATSIEMTSAADGTAVENLFAALCRQIEAHR